MKVSRYAAVGATAAATDFLIFAIFAKMLNMNYPVVGAIGFILATFINYFLSIRFVFESAVRFGFSEGNSAGFPDQLLSLGCKPSRTLCGIGILEWEMMLTKLYVTGAVFFGNLVRNRSLLSNP